MNGICGHRLLARVPREVRVKARHLAGERTPAVLAHAHTHARTHAKYARTHGPLSRLL